MKRAYFWIPTLVGFFLSWWWVDKHPRQLPPGMEIELAAAASEKAPFQALKEGDLIWLIDEKGQMMTQEGSILWLDQLDQILRDEKRAKTRKSTPVIVELVIDRRCPFESIAPLLQLGAKHAIHMQLRLLPTENK